MTSFAETTERPPVIAVERALVTVDRAAAEAAVRTLIAWAGDDPDRSELARTPERVALSYAELFAGYRMDPLQILARWTLPASSSGQVITLRDIRFTSMCEHHMLPFSGLAHVSYVPHERMVGIGSIAGVVEALARRLQVQERLTEGIADAIRVGLEPTGVAVVVEAEHLCMTARGVSKVGARFITRRAHGCLACAPGVDEGSDLPTAKS
jgi:GTP cyclohydrolase IA